MISLSRSYRCGEYRSCDGAAHHFLEFFRIFVFESLDCSLAEERVSTGPEVGDSSQTGLLLAVLFKESLGHDHVVHQQSDQDAVDRVGLSFGALRVVGLEEVSFSFQQLKRFLVLFASHQKRHERKHTVRPVDLFFGFGERFEQQTEDPLGSLSIILLDEEPGE